jgi:hypothetical protein
MKSKRISNATAEGAGPAEYNAGEKPLNHFQACRDRVKSWKKKTVI